jgi:hypothetical protein
MKWHGVFLHLTIEQAAHESQQEVNSADGQLRQDGEHALGRCCAASRLAGQACHCALHDATDGCLVEP